MTPTTPKQLREEVEKILVFEGKHEPTPAEMERWTEDYRRHYVADRLMALLQANEQAVRREERLRIKSAWQKLNIVGGAAAGSAQGLIVRNPWGETDSMQVDREAFAEFWKALSQGNEEEKEKKV